MSLEKFLIGQPELLTRQEYVLLTPIQQEQYEQDRKANEQASLKIMQTSGATMIATMLCGIVLSGYLSLQQTNQQIENCKEAEVKTCRINISRAYGMALSTVALGFTIGMGGTVAGLRKRRKLDNETTNQYRALLK